MEIRFELVTMDILTNKDITPKTNIATPDLPCFCAGMRLQQGQIWKTSPAVHSHDGKPLYLRIVELERLSVAYKEMTSATAQDGKHKLATKKELCRFIKSGEVVG